MTTITIAINDHLAHALLMAKHDYLVARVLPADMRSHQYRIDNYDRLDKLYLAIRWALDAPADASIA